MFSHIMVGSNDVDRSQKFYDALFGAIGARLGMRDEKGVDLKERDAANLQQKKVKAILINTGCGLTRHA